MRKLIICLGILLIPMFMFGCTGGTETGETNVKVSEIMNKMKTKIREDMIMDLEEELKDTTDEDRKTALNEQITKLKEMKDEDTIEGMIEVDLKATTDDMQNMPEINSDDILEGRMLESQINVRSDKIIILKAKDEEKVQGLKESLDKIKAEQEENWKTYLPDQYKKVQDGIIKTKGLYLVYIVHDNASELEKIFDDMVTPK